MFEADENEYLEQDLPQSGDIANYETFSADRKANRNTDPLVSSPSFNYITEKRVEHKKSEPSSKQDLKPKSKPELDYESSCSSAQLDDM